ncbi:unnamed protein product [Didymodactylos carnosus]|uniref:Uncharacterized protein n=1 Tax=Didymodactylos carnosus TaxID=1234261 RepID=A0A813PME3_9BILA|nr:unnamed protein product [Didymodactylos carnosus]CAF3532876.1 unnamed protein product [Didymodactylos carnosus]
MSTILDRLEGALVGHALCDRFNASTKMAFQLGESLMELKEFDSSDVLSRYLWLYHTSTNNCDMGEIIKLVYHDLVSQIKTKKNNKITQQDFKFHVQQINATSEKVNEKLHGLTAGCNPAHRSYPIALYSSIHNDDVFDISKQEACLTHYSPEAGQVSGIVNLICRSLIIGQTWDSAVNNAFCVPNLSTDIQQIVSYHGRSSHIFEAKPSAYAPKVLKIALDCVKNSKFFKDAYERIYRIDNIYAPPIVGILAGAQWGLTSMLNMINDSDQSLSAIRKMANELAQPWERILEKDNSKVHV